MAVGHLSPATRTRVRPMFDIPSYVKTDKKTIDQYLREGAGEFAVNWGVALPAFFDFQRYGPERKSADGRHPLTKLLKLSHVGGHRIQKIADERSAALQQVVPGHVVVDYFRAHTHVLDVRRCRVVVGDNRALANLQTYRHPGESFAERAGVEAS